MQEGMYVTFSCYYLEKSSEKLIWEDYVRNHKGQIPPQVRKNN